MARALTELTTAGLINIIPACKVHYLYGSCLISAFYDSVVILFCYDRLYSGLKNVGIRDTESVPDGP